MNTENIHIFRSNIQTPADVAEVGIVLDIHPQIDSWTLDLHDDERILRVVSEKLTDRKITELVALCGYQCEELND